MTKPLTKADDRGAYDVRQDKRLESALKGVSVMFHDDQFETTYTYTIDHLRGQKKISFFPCIEHQGNSVLSGSSRQM